MDKEFDYFTIEDFLHYIDTFVKSSKQALDFGLYLDKDKWKAYVTTYPTIEETNLRSALYWLCMHLKNDAKDDFFSYK